MKRTLVIIGVCLVAAGLAQAIEVDMQIKTEVTVASAYVWRGDVVTDEEVIQPSLAVTAGNTKLTVWGTWDLDHKTNSSEHTRIDTILEYQKDYENYRLSGGIIAYLYHDAPTSYEDDTFEAFMDYSLNAPLLPALTLYYDFGEIKGFYGKAAVAHSFELVEKTLALDLGASVGAGDSDYTSTRFTFPVPAVEDENGNRVEQDDFVPDDPSLIDLVGKVSLPWIWSEQVELVTGAKYVMLLDKDIADAAEAAGEDTDETVYSVTLRAFF